MGKLILISGANGSGKSRYAELLLSRTTGERYYIATMQPQTPENHQRIAKHRLQRQGLAFHTLELPCGLQNARLPQAAVVLLEDVSNLLGNLLFEHNGTPRRRWRKAGHCRPAASCWWRLPYPTFVPMNISRKQPPTSMP